jgi:hypothetical protein
MFAASPTPESAVCIFLRFICSLGVWYVPKPARPAAKNESAASNAENAVPAAARLSFRSFMPWMSGGSVPFALTGSSP